MYKKIEDNQKLLSQILQNGELRFVACIIVAKAMKFIRLRDQYLVSCALSSDRDETTILMCTNFPNMLRSVLFSNDLNTRHFGQVWVFEGLRSLSLAPKWIIQHQPRQSH